MEYRNGSQNKGLGTTVQYFLASKSKFKVIIQVSITRKLLSTDGLT